MYAPAGLETIADSAFYGCSSLVSITLPDSLTDIGVSAFRDCAKLTSVTFGGTIDEWLEMSYQAGSAPDNGKTTVRCSDGTVKFSFS